MLINKIKEAISNRKKYSLDKKLIDDYFLSHDDWPKQQFEKNSKGLLLYSMTNWHYQIQMEFMFAYLAEFSGLKVYLAGYPLAHQYWRRGGFPNDRIINWSKLHSYYTDDANFIAEEAIRDCENFIQLRGFEFDGLPIGKHVLSAIGRKQFRADVDLKNRDIKKSIKELICVAIANVFTMRQVMREYNIAQLLINEANYTNAGVSQEVIRSGGKYIQFVYSYEEGAFVFKRYGSMNNNVHPISLSDNSWDQLKNKPIDLSIETKINDINEQKYSDKFLLSRRIGLDLPAESPEDLRKRLGLDNGKKNAVIFSHVLWDANMFWGDDLFPGGAEEWLVETVRFALLNPRINWIVKIHPANVWKMETKGLQVVYNDVEALREKIGPLPGHIQLLLPEHKVNPRSLFDITDVGITIRGTIGMELPVLGIPVLTAGTGRYSKKGFTIDPRNIEEYKEYILSLDKLGKLTSEEQDCAKRFFYGAFYQRLWRSSLHESICKSDDPLQHSLHLKPWSNFSEGDRALVNFFADTDLEDYIFQETIE